MRTLTEILGNHTNIGDFLVDCNLEYKFFAENVLGLEVMPYHNYWIDCFLNKRRTCITAPRGSGKTYTLGVAFTLWVSLFRKDKKFLIVAASKDGAKDIVKEIKMAIENNELLRDMLEPQGREFTWSSTELRLKTGCHIVIRAFTPKGIRGNHVDYTLADEGGEMHDHKLFFGSLVPTVAHRNGNIMVIGTPTTELDLLYELNDSKRGYHCRTYDMWDEDTGRSLWPSKFPKKKLELLKQEQGTITFMREYRCRRVDEGVQPFKFKDIVRSFDNKERFYSFGKYYELGEDKGEWGDYYIGVDLAMSPQGDYSVYTVVEKINDKVVIKNIQRVKGIQYKSQEKMVEQLYRDFKPIRLVVDKSVFGDVFIQDLMSKGIPAEPFVFNPDNRNLILNNLMRLFENDLIKIPRYKDDEACLRETTNLIEELEKIIQDKTPTGMRTFKSIGLHDDAVMSFAMAAYAATEYGPYTKAGVESIEAESGYVKPIGIFDNPAPPPFDKPSPPPF